MPMNMKLYRRVNSLLIFPKLQCPKAKFHLALLTVFILMYLFLSILGNEQNGQ